MTTHPLTEDRAEKLWNAHVHPVLNFLGWTWSDRNDILAALRDTYDAGSAEWKANAEAAAERAERAEDKLADSVHVDESSRRVEAAREQGWDDAAEWMKDELPGVQWAANALNVANPYRHAPTLPTEDGAVIVPADGHEYIATKSGKRPRRLTWDAEQYVWYDAHGTHLDVDIIPGTWTADSLDGDA